MKGLAVAVGIGFLCVSWQTDARGQFQPSKPKADPGAVYFEKHVRPILAGRCYSCHSEAQKKRKGSLTLDTAAGFSAGGDSGPIFDREKPGESNLLHAIRYEDDLKMPPKGKLPQAEIDALARWIQMGAPWPDAKAVASSRKPGLISDDDRQWWAFRPLKPVEVPKAGDGWARNPIDRFVADAHSKAGLTPAPEAARATLARRLGFDLTGLPPAPESVDGFAADSSKEAYETLVNQLLASPRHGERQARLWLDLVRYADSDGYRLDEYRPNAHLYRDYVVRSFNADKPYDRFVQEQLAGDEMFPGEPDAIIALGYLRHWIYEYNQRDARTQWSVILNDLTDTTSDVFLGVGLQCARCHDHKFDPLLQKDYYRLQAFLSNVLPREDIPAATPEQKAEHARKLKVWEQATETVRAQIADLEKPYREKAAEYSTSIFPADVESFIRKPAHARLPMEHQLAELGFRQVTYEYNRIDTKMKGADKERHIALKRELAKFDNLKPAPLPLPLTVTDVGPTASPVTIPKKGNTPVAPGFLTILDDKPAEVEPSPTSSGRRTALARWITDPKNPLTARVIVNRAWQQHFGRGLAANASDFGKLGDPPTHPELLDWLALDFIEHGWSLKHLHRRIVTSATYRQASSHPDPSRGKLVDPENKLLWRGSIRRLEAEPIRDALLFVSGEIDLRSGGPGVFGNDPRRSLYVRIMRNVRDPLFDVFDAPLWFQSASGRDVTTTPVQSLYLFNGPFLLQRAKAFADRVFREEPSDAPNRIRRAYRLAFGREPSKNEVEQSLAFIDQQAGSIDPEVAGSAAAAFVSGKIPFHDGQADEVKPTGTGMMVASVEGAKPKDSKEKVKEFPTDTFTIEAFLVPRSVAADANVRTIAARWDGNAKSAGWALGLTGKQSRRKPQTVVLQLFGRRMDGTFGEETVFSDHNVAMNKPYYVAAIVRPASASKAGEVTFVLKDLSNDDDPVQIATVPNRIRSGLDNDLPLTLGGRSGKSAAGFDGLIDDVRLSASALKVDDLLLNRDGLHPTTVGFWTFENKPDVFRDASGQGRDLKPARKPKGAVDPKKAAWADFCHVLFNASEFLYVE